MNEIKMLIDGKEVTATDEMTVLDVARGEGILIPTLCNNEKLKPYGGCRLCIVEAEYNGFKTIIASCVRKAENGLRITTRSEKICKLRKTMLEMLMYHAPHSPLLVELAEEYGANADRFGKSNSFCIHCGLCVRYCEEVKKKNAVGFIDRGVKKEISFVPEIASVECKKCKECFPLCPTSYLQAAYVLSEAMSVRGSDSDIREVERGHAGVVKDPL